MEYKEIYQKEHQTSPAYRTNNWGLYTLKFWLPRFDFKTAIEVGCGNGRLLSALSSMGIRCNGVDIVDGVYNRAGYSYFHQDITKTKLPFGNNQLDIGLSFDCLEHLVECDIDFTIRELLRVSKAQAIMISHTPAAGLHLTVKDWFWWLEKLISLSGSHNWETIHIKRNWSDVTGLSPGEIVSNLDASRDRTLYLHGESK